MGFIRYPDIIPAAAEITAINPPANIVARINGKIDTIFVKNGERTEKDMILALLQSSAKWDDIRAVEKYIFLLDTIQQANNFRTLLHPSFFRNSLSLGELQGSYAELKIDYITLYNYLNSGLHEEECNNMSSRIAAQSILLNRLKNKKELQIKQYRLIEKEFERDSIIHLQNGISDNQYEQQYQNLLQAKSSLVDMDINIENTAFTIEQYQSDLNK